MRYNKKDAELDKIKDFVQVVKHSDDYHEALNIIIQELLKLTNVPIITIMLFDDKTNELFIAESCGIKDEQKTLRLKPGKGVCGKTFKNKKIILLNDTTNKNQNHGYISFEGLPNVVRSELCLPLTLKDS